MVRGRRSSLASQPTTPKYRTQTAKLWHTDEQDLKEKKDQPMNKRVRLGSSEECCTLKDEYADYEPFCSLNLQ